MKYPSYIVWHIQGRDQILRRILLKVTLSDLSSGEEENQRAEPYRDRQKLSNSLVLTRELQEENEWSMHLALRTRSFFTLTIIIIMTNILISYVASNNNYLLFCGYIDLYIYNEKYFSDDQFSYNIII